MPIQVNVTTKVNSQSIRREMYNGREHIVIPSYTLPANVIMNKEFYPASEIDANYKSLEGTLAPLGHPTVNGEFVSAFSPEGLNIGYFGAWNRNAKKSGNRIYVEKWVDIATAQESEKGREFLERIEAIENNEDVPPIHTSVAVFRERIEASPAQKAQGADWVVKISSIDHDAILLHEVGAATPEQGVGLMVNADLATPLAVNSGALVGESYRELEKRLEQAARERFVINENDYVWIADFTNSQAVVISNGGNAQVYGYSSEGGKITFDDTGTAVARHESWISIIANKCKSIFNQQARPATNNQEGEMPLTPEERKELCDEMGKVFAANLAEVIKPISDKVDSIQANHDKLTETLTANSRAEEKAKRDAVAAKHGEIVANSLSGEALELMYKSLGESVSLGGNSATTETETGAPDSKTYFAGAK